MLQVKRGSARPCALQHRIRQQRDSRGTANSKSHHKRQKCTSGEPPEPEEEQEQQKRGSIASVGIGIISSPFSYVTLGFFLSAAVVSKFEGTTLIVLLSALPIIGLTAISKIPAIRTKLEGDAEKARLADSQRLEAFYEEEEEAKKHSKWYGHDRIKCTETPPAHLKGELPGDLGFDPLCLGTPPSALSWNFTCELLHSRWAMLGTVGALFPEVLSKISLRLQSNAFLSSFLPLSLGETRWWRVGLAKLKGDTLNYLGIDGLRVAGGQGVFVIFLVQLVLMGGPEYARRVGIRSLEPVGIYLSGDENYPGSKVFDPLGLAYDPYAFAEQKVWEVHIGRLAMVAFAGFAAQALVSSDGPFGDLLYSLGV